MLVTLARCAAAILVLCSAWCLQRSCRAALEMGTSNVCLLVRVADVGVQVLEQLQACKACMVGWLVMIDASTVCAVTQFFCAAPGHSEYS